MSLASDLINEFYDRAVELRKEDRYLEALSLESLGNLVNNLHHGRSPLEWLPEAISAADGTMPEMLGLDDDESREPYAEGISLLEDTLQEMSG